MLSDPRGRRSLVYFYQPQPPLFVLASVGFSQPELTWTELRPAGIYSMDLNQAAPELEVTPWSPEYTSTWLLPRPEGLRFAFAYPRPHLEPVAALRFHLSLAVKRRVGSMPSLIRRYPDAHARQSFRNFIQRRA